MPTLGRLPAAFSSAGTVVCSRGICDALMCEHSSQSDYEDVALGTYPLNADHLICELLDNTLAFVLYETEEVFNHYTKPLIASVYGYNSAFAWLKPGMIREETLTCFRSKSSIKSAEDCVGAIKSVMNLLSHTVDVTESMKLPLRITSKLFSRMSVLLSIPMSFPSLRVLSDYLSTAPEMLAVEAWCVRINAGCKMWDERTIRRRQDSVEFKTRESWWNWLGWAGHDNWSSTNPTTIFRPNKSHNVLFAMTSVSAIFVYVAVVLNSSRK